jgi:hypothetical protein
MDGRETMLIMKASVTVDPGAKWYYVTRSCDSAISSVVAPAGVRRLPLIPVGICYNIGVNSSIDASAVHGFLLIALYIGGLAWLAGYWLERRELLLH